MIPKTDSNYSKNWVQKLIPKNYCNYCLHYKNLFQKLIPKIACKYSLQTLLRNIACKHCCNAETTFQNCCKWFANIAKYFTLAVMDFLKSCLHYFLKIEGIVSKVGKNHECYHPNFSITCGYLCIHIIHTNEGPI